MTDDATHDDTLRPGAPGRDDGVGVLHEDMRYSLSLEQVGNVYAERGFPRSARSLQRFCANGHLDCSKIATTTGDKYLVAPYSVERHLKQLAQLAATDAATGAGVARQVATPVGQANDSDVANDQPRQDMRHATPGNDGSKPDGGGDRDTSQLVVQLEKRIGEKDDEIKFLRSEVATKNHQLADASERDRETNVLIQGLQSMVLQLTGNDKPDALSGIDFKRQGTGLARPTMPPPPTTNTDRHPSKANSGRIGPANRHDTNESRDHGNL